MRTDVKEIVTLLAIVGMLTSCELGSDGSKRFNGASYKTVKSPYTGRIWMDRNVGADRVCLSATDDKCFGDYFQYGRVADGHEKRNSKTRDTQITYLDKADDRFYIGGTSEWYIGNEDLSRIMGKLDGSGMCPKGFRVPIDHEFFEEFYEDGTSAELEKEDSLFDTFLKIPSAGYRQSLSYRSRVGEIVDVGKESYMHIKDEGICYDRSRGRPIRCIKGTKEELENAKTNNR